MFLLKKSICLASMKDASVILTAGTPPSTASVSQRTADHSCGLGKRNTGWPRAGLLQAPWGKNPMKPSRTPRSGQATATDPQLPSCQENTLLKQETHTKNNPRGSGTDYLFYKVWDVCRGNSRYNWPSTPLFLLQYIIYFKTMTMPSLFQRSQVKETWMSV